MQPLAAGSSLAAGWLAFRWQFPGLWLAFRSQFAGRSLASGSWPLTPAFLFPPLIPTLFTQ